MNTSEPFLITLADNIQFTVTPTYLNDRDLTYELSIDGKVHGSLIPDINDEIGLTWRTEDNIDPRPVGMIGKLIDEHEA